MAITYAPTTNFGLKDSLPTNDSDKVIRGSEFTTEFTAIQTAFSLAAPTASPTFTGTVTIPTADINGGNIDGTVIGAATPAAGSFTTGQFGTSLNVDGTVTADGVSSDGNISMSGAGTGSRYVILGDETNTYAGSLVMQAGGGSAAYGGSVIAYGHSHATKPGDIVAGISSGSGGSFRVNTSGIDGGADVLVVKSTGNVGIGTASITNSAGFKRLAINDTSGGILEQQVGGTATGRLITSAASVSLDAITSIPLTFKTAATERMRIDSSGNVGVGTSSPAGITSGITTLAISDAGAKTTGDKAGALSFITDDTSFTGTYSNGVTAEISSISESSTGASYGLAFATSTTGGAGRAERMRIDASGDVGIGTSSPATRLELSGVKDTSELRLSSTTNDASWAANQYFGKLSFYSADSSGAGAGIKGSIVSACTGGSSGATAHMAFSVASTSANDVERMRIDATGNVGIGTTSPTAGKLQLDVGGSLAGVRVGGVTGGNQDFWAVRNGSSSIQAGPNITLQSATGTTYATTIQLGPTGEQLFFNYDGSAWNERMRIDSSGNLILKGNDLDFNNGTALHRITNDNTNLLIRADYGNTNANSTIQFSVDGTERARIDSSGNLLVGTTTPSGPTTGFAVLGPSYTSAPRALIAHPSGTAGGNNYAEFLYAGSAIGSISQNGTTGVLYNTSSDYRLKDVDGPITNSGAYIDALKPVQGSWKVDGSRFIGLIAHEVQEVSETQIATGEKDGEEMQGMDYSSPELIANLIAEIQSLRARVAQLEGA